MTQSFGHPGATPLPRRLASTPLVVAVLASALLSAPAVPVIAATAPGAGSATNALPSSPVPVEAPDVPQVPVPLPPTPQPPPVSTPSATSTPTAEGAGHVLGGGAGEVVEGIAQAPSQAEGAGATPGSGTGGEPSAPTTTRRPDQRSIGPAESAPLRRWRAYVWPAVALRVRDALMPLLASLDSFRAIHVPDAFEVLSPAPSTGSIGIGLSSKRPTPPSQDLQSPAEPALPDAGTSLLATLLIGLLAVVGLGSLARLVVGEELFEDRHWRGHRG